MYGIDNVVVFLGLDVGNSAHHGHGLTTAGTSIGALPLTRAQDSRCKIAHLPGLVTRRISDLYPGEAKTDAKDAAVIADAARTMSHTLRSLELTDEVTAELTVLVGFDPDLAAEATRTSNRIRGLFTQFHHRLGRTPQAR